MRKMSLSGKKILKSVKKPNFFVFKGNGVKLSSNLRSFDERFAWLSFKTKKLGFFLRFSIFLDIFEFLDIFLNNSEMAHFGKKWVQNKL